jgi:GAF domain-containing protein
VDSLRWSWLAAPYLGCAAVIATVAFAAALIRGDRVMRLGVIAAATTAIPWAVTQGMVACTDDPDLATRTLRLGQGTVALIGPNLLLVLLATSGQLERQKWIARTAAVVGAILMVLCWSSPWIVPGVQRLGSGMFYMRPGPLTSLATSQLPLWLGVGLVIVRRSTPTAERRRNARLIVGVLVCGAVGSLDMLVLYHVWGSYPIAWLSASTGASIALYLVVRTDFLRPQGLDADIAIELGAFVLSLVCIAVLVRQLDGVTPIVTAAVTSLAWVVLTGIAWAIARTRVVRVAAERELELFVTRVVTLDDEAKIADRLGALWQKSVGIVLRQLRTDPVDPEVAAWFVKNIEALATSDLATMRLGPLRPALEAISARATLLVPLVDRGQLVGMVEADFDKALRDAERGLVVESAKAAARALTFVKLSKAAARERETAREVEIADALRLQASASREAELGKWAVAAEYRTAARTTGAGWSAIELPDGRLALLATEAQAHGVAAALATAAITGAFAAATLGVTTLDDILAAMQTSAAGVMRGGEPVSAFLAIIGSEIEWACAGHPGAFLVGPVASLEGGAPAGSIKSARPDAIQMGPGARVADMSNTARGKALLPADTLLVVASTGLRGTDDARWQGQLREAAFASGRLATVLVDDAMRRGAPAEDLLAVVVRAR